LPIDPSISFGIFLEFIMPPRCIGFWHYEVFGASVPETAIDEYGELHAPPADIHPGRCCRKRPEVDPEP